MYYDATGSTISGDVGGEDAPGPANIKVATHERGDGSEDNTIKGDLAFNRLMMNASKIKPIKVKFTAASCKNAESLSNGGGSLILQLYCAALVAREANNNGNPPNNLTASWPMSL